ncbi:S-layer homology domain-containing protein [Paenibacillus amylolyticus]|uniref:Cellulosome anchoring protein cohesin subunit n=1 Tax=Paenibacillus amylolyticus TaxID=1451 RepID=A0A100VK88_PAEAM|nr:S-layer homology domain-containing protein [Paenibacillus amylolyticus]GAS81385.1 cellulosome anchoring protein cohesin subunit [Paenibacillus amylolyticus]
MFQPKKKRPRIRRTMSGLIALTLLSSLVFPSIAGAEPVEPSQVQFANVSVQAGQTVHVPVALKKSHFGVKAYNMQIDYDTSALEIVRITPKSVNVMSTSPNEEGVADFQYKINNAEGWVRIIWVDFTGGDHSIVDETQLFDMEIKAKSNATPGTKQLSVDQTDSEHWHFTNVEHENYTELSGGTITITAANSGGGNSGSPGSSSGGSVSPTTPVVTPVPSNPAVTKGVDIYVNGQKQEQSATATTSTVGNQVTTTVHVDNEKVINQIGSGLRTLLLPITGTGKGAVVGELNGKLVKTMEGSNAEVVIQTDSGTYTLPANQIQVDQVLNQFGSTVPLEDITIQIAIVPSAASKQTAIQAAADKLQNTTVIATPVDFEVKAIWNGQQVNVDRFNSYVERSITLPEGVDGSKITTGVVLQPDGSLLHVPTKVIKGNGQDSAIINSLTNSTYALIYHPATFSDVTSHWSRDDVQDLASRLIVQGTGDNVFAPDRSITRAEFTAVLLRGLGLHSPISSEAASFTDVKTGSWYEDEVQTAVSYGLISGYADDSFRPNNEISRAEALTIVSRAMKLVGLAQADASETTSLLSAYSDSAKVQAWAAEPVASAIKQELVQGDDGKLMTDADISRAQSAAIVKRLLAKAGLI